MNPLFVYLLIGITIAGGAGYIVGQSPIPQLRSDIVSLEISQTQIQSQLASSEAQNQLLLTKIQEISANLTTLTQTIGDLSVSYQQTLGKYENSLEKYQSLLSSYYTLLLEYQGQTPPSTANLTITKVAGVENGGFDGNGEPWVMQGKGGKNPYATLWQWDRGSYVTQTIQLTSEVDGFVFDVKPQPSGASVTLEVRVGNILVFSKLYQGSNSLYGWKQEVVSLQPLFRMREQYGFIIAGSYEIRFTIPAGVDNSAQMWVDNVSLVEIEYTPP